MVAPNRLSPLWPKPPERPMDEPYYARLAVRHIPNVDNTDTAYMVGFSVGAILITFIAVLISILR